MLSSTGNDVESGANGFRVSRGDSGLAENDGANPREESDNHDNQPVRSSSSAIQRNSGKSDSQDRDDPLSPSAVHGSTPLSQIGAHGCAPVNDMYLGQGESNPRELPSNRSFYHSLSPIEYITALAKVRSAESRYVVSFPSTFFFFSWDKSTFLDNLYLFYSESG